MPPLTVWNANFCLVDNIIFLWPIYSFFFPFSGSNGVADDVLDDNDIDRYNYMGYGIDFKE